MKMFLLGFITGILSIPMLVFLYGVAVFMWGDWRTGDIWSTIKEDRRMRKHLKENEKENRS